MKSHTSPQTQVEVFLIISTFLFCLEFFNTEIKLFVIMLSMGTCWSRQNNTSKDKCKKGCSSKLVPNITLICEEVGLCRNQQICHHFSYKINQIKTKHLWEYIIVFCIHVFPNGINSLPSKYDTRFTLNSLKIIFMSSWFAWLLSI